MKNRKTVSPLIEIVTRGDQGYVPLGIVNVEQALRMPQHLDLQFSHPEHDPAQGRVYIDRIQLRDVIGNRSSHDVPLGAI
ncbi:hypothetical protein QA644_24890 (plasmid) [Rhizobium sp. CC1099]|uniref:hypothetical protein n=1 Tax=Rhizobium sp. CC1099 TaxID=3039160 RepID=UPI0024B0CC98|nr:hypothetical protein [Rhizobium sp. CC1099]WFU91401.1 hypothetical protein QA644_24890 [Rhizobium sp. CC1099]